MKIIRTASLKSHDLNPTDQLCAYNGLDCCITYEVLERLLPQLSSTTRVTYDFSRALQGPVLDMNSRGIRIDEERRQAVIEDYRRIIWDLTDSLNGILREGIGFEFEVARTRKWAYPS